MKEIIGENLRKFFENAKIQGLITYSGHIGYWPHFEVWEVQERDYERMCDMTDEEFEQIASKDSWWRSAEGSNMGTVNEEFIINGMPLMAWRDEDRVSDYEDEWNDMDEEEQSEYENFEDFLNKWFPKEHPHLLEYFCNELGASTGRNICALATDLAKYNNITMAELFKRYGGSYEDN
ncbi:MAG: hypothetical protein UHD64_06050 [Bacteroidales bacterium]|nr:hypothetical protein [Bacteroidales bacterium]